MRNDRYSLGLDFGTSCVRALIVRCHDGAEVGAGVCDYPHGVEGVLVSASEPDLARQHPADYVDGLRAAIQSALTIAHDCPDFGPEKIVGIGVDTTGSTPIPVDAAGVPLALSTEFASDLNAMAWLWKDHTAHREAAEITERSNAAAAPYMAMVGGAYSSEWLWSKVLRCARIAPRVFEAAHTWLELCDYVPSYLTQTGVNVKRSACAAGHKGLFNRAWGGLPSEAFFNGLDPRLGALRGRLFERAYASDTIAGNLDATVAAELGLPAGIPVAVGAIDAHMGAVGSGVGDGILVKILGTSACDILVAPAPASGEIEVIPGVAGAAMDSVLPQRVGIEAGQAAVGDLFNWWVRQLGDGASHAELSVRAAKLRPGQSGLLALDWNNGNRCVLADPRLSGLLVGQTLATQPHEIYRAWIEATAFGSLAIIRRLESYGVVVDSVVACGGIAEKNPLVMQIYADVSGKPMRLSRSSQTCALGAAIFGAVVGGAHADVPSAQAAMTGLKEVTYEPDAAAHAVYGELFKLYMELHDAFGGVARDASLGYVMKRLLEIRDVASER